MGLFSGAFQGICNLNADAARALNAAELAQRQYAQAAMMQQYRPAANDMLALLNYRPPVHVPVGWAEWSAHAGEMV